MTSEGTGAPQLPAGVQHDVDEAFGQLIEKVNQHEEMFQKAAELEAQNARNQPKAWFNDPYTLLDSFGLGYRAAPTALTYETLRNVSERDTAVGSVIFTRVNQVAAFARQQENKYSVGFVVRPRGRDKRRRLTASEKDRVHEIEHFLLNTGRDFNLGRDSFDGYLRKTTRDRLTYDQIGTEKVRTLSGHMHSFHAVPADTLRIAQPKVAKGTPPAVVDIKRDIKYVQVLNAQIAAEFTIDEMMFGVANPRTNVRVAGYGFSEIEQLITTITSHLYAEEWNRRSFSQGSTVKGMINMQGNPRPEILEAFKRQWFAQTSGIANAWKTPVMALEGGVQWIPMQMTNVEMGYQMWVEYLIKIITAIFQIDPAEINFDLRGSSQAAPIFMSNNEAQQKVSKDRGLQPLLRFLEDLLNKHIVWQIDPRFEVAFVGLDAKSEDQAMQLRMQQVQNVYTLNEIRALEDLPPLDGGDVVLNPTYTAALAQKQAAAQQQQMMGAGGGLQPGQPGGQPQAAAGQQQDDGGQPYQGRFQGNPPGDEEQQGVDRLHAFLQNKSGSDDGGSSDASSVDPVTQRYLRQNDWASSLHSSVRDNDLRKSEYVLIDLDR